MIFILIYPIVERLTFHRIRLCAYVYHNQNYANFPDGYPSIFVVSATDHNDKKAGYSSYTPNEKYN